MGKRFEVILFDLGDTLIYFDGDWPEVFRRAQRGMLRTLQAGGLKLGEDFLDDFHARMEAYFRERDTEFIEHTTRYVLQECLAGRGLADLPDELLTRALADMHTITQAHWLPEADAVPALQALCQRGYRLGLVSNAADDANTQVLVDKLGARPYLEAVVSSAAQGVRKPNPKIFYAAMQQIGAAPERTAMVGDNLGADVLGAHNAGIYAIWITRRADTAANRAHRDTIFPDAQAATLADLVVLLDDLE